MYPLSLSLARARNFDNRFTICVLINSLNVKFDDKHTSSRRMEETFYALREVYRKNITRRRAIYI